MKLHAGQCWQYRAPAGFEDSRLIIGAVATFDGGRSIVCAAVIHAPRRFADAHVEAVTIPFLPMTEDAFRASVVTCEGMQDLPPDFAEKLDAWSRDPKGLSCFTVPFEGSLDVLIARQMAEIAGRDAA